MTEPTTESLTKSKCLPCEGGVEPLDATGAETFLKATPKWEIIDDGKMISRKVICKHFKEAMQLLNNAGEVAEAENHHPDFHLTSYRNVQIDLSTHAIGGLSENDFIVAAKIDQVINR